MRPILARRWSGASLAPAKGRGTATRLGIGMAQESRPGACSPDELMVPLPDGTRKPVRQAPIAVADKPTVRQFATLVKTGWGTLLDREERHEPLRVHGPRYGQRGGISTGLECADHADRARGEKGGSPWASGRDLAGVACGQRSATLTDTPPGLWRYSARAVGSAEAALLRKLTDGRGRFAGLHAVGRPA
jgi:hypothetical protein